MITDTDRLVCGVAPCFGARAHGGIFWRAEEFECATCLGVTLLRPVERKPCGRTHERVGHLTAVALRRSQSILQRESSGSPPAADARKRVAE
jgi:hypothetical protein